MHESSLDKGYFKPPDFTLQELSPLEMQEVTGGDDIAWWTGYVVGKVRNGLVQIGNGVEWAWLTGGASYQGMYISYTSS